jgi:hypothetical protein
MFSTRPLATNERFFNSSPNTQMGARRADTPSTTTIDLVIGRFGCNKKPARSREKDHSISQIG